MSSTEKLADVEKMDQGDSSRRKTIIVRLLILFFAEFLGTALLLFVGCLGVAARTQEPQYVPSYFGGFSFGLAVVLCIHCVGYASGAHINPQVSLAALILGKIDVKSLFVYFIAEFLGAIAGTGLLLLLWPSDSHPECGTNLHPNITTLQGVALEMTITFALILACCSNWDTRNSDSLDSVAIRMGLVVAAIAMGEGFLTGASMNTARSFGPALWDNKWDNHWVYWVGPTIGSLSAAFLSKYVLSRQVEGD
ncbi:hypothetical protein FQA39_LY12035 [Lamprigera yunnana]|nr:hypothetical protein FQA39_LY12035 [Lamprigera yunnana]